MLIRGWRRGGTGKRRGAEREDIKWLIVWPRMRLLCPSFLSSSRHGYTWAMPGMVLKPCKLVHCLSEEHNLGWTACCDELEMIVEVWEWGQAMDGARSVLPHSSLVTLVLSFIPVEGNATPAGVLRIYEGSSPVWSSKPIIFLGVNEEKRVVDFIFCLCQRHEQQHLISLQKSGFHRCLFEIVTVCTVFHPCRFHLSH